MKKINVLGREYAVTYTEKEEDLRPGNVAEVDYSDRTIMVLTKIGGEELSKEYVRDGLIHEVAHAFLYETGQSDLNDERHAEMLAKFAVYVHEEL